MSKLKKLFKTPKLFFYDALKKRLKANNKQTNLTKKTSREYFRELYTFIEYYDVNSIKLNNEYIWPYLRNHLISNLYEISLGKYKFLELNPWHLQNGHHSQINEEFRQLLKKDYEAKELEEIQHCETDFLFFVPMNGFGRTEINNKVYHRIVDPLFSVAQEMGSATKIEIVKNSHLPAIKYWHKYAYKSLIILPHALTKSGYSQKLKFNDNFFKMFKRYIPSLSTPNRTLLNEVIDFELHTRDFYIELLKKLKPKVICLYAYHFNAPLISAAHELGILSVDLQHGLQVGWGPIYNNHEELPISGYQAYPDIFAVWGEKEFQHISNTFTSLKHKAIYMGNPWLNTLSNFPDQLSESIKKKLLQKETTILIILQDQLAIPPIIKEIIKKSSSDILWVIRHHPSTKKKFVNTDFTMKSNILINTEIDKIRFNELFKYIDIAISEGSALTYEASYYGVENILTGLFGYENYKDEIKKGLFYFMNNEKEFKNILHKIKTKKTKSTTQLFADVSPKEVLKKLLKFSQELKNSHSKLNLSKSNNIDLGIQSSIENDLNTINKNIDQRQIQEALNAFNTLRKRLSHLDKVQNIYNKNIDLYIKKAKIYRRRMQQNNLSVSSHVIYMISDSLCLPRKNSLKTASKIIAEEFKSFSISTWGQNYLDTTKLLNYWSHIVQDIKDVHLILHLGITDCFPRIYLEKQYIGLNLLPQELRQRVIKFSSQYQGEILSNQKENSFVTLNEFTHNVEHIIKKLILQKPKSITLINIINHPKLNIETIPTFNKSLDEVTLKFPQINVLNLDKILNQNGYDKYMLPNHINLNAEGHKLLAKEIIKKLDENEGNK